MVLTEKIKYAVMLALSFVLITGYWMYGFNYEAVYVRVGGFIAVHGFSVGVFWHLVDRMKKLNML